jgi:hypothetical protein
MNEKNDITSKEIKKLQTKSKHHAKEETKQKERK